MLTNPLPHSNVQTKGERTHITMRIFCALLVLAGSGSTSPFFLGDLLQGLFGSDDNNSNSGSSRPSNSGRNEGCGGRNQPNHRFGGKDYLVSWRLGCTSFTQSGAESFCRKSNMRPISIDSSAEEREFLGLVGRENQKYFWTGGKLSGRGSSIQWPSGRRYNSVNWSRTGG